MKRSANVTRLAVAPIGRAPIPGLLYSRSSAIGLLVVENDVELERGQINPSLRKLLELASALGMEAGKLVGEVDDKIRKFKPKR